MDRLTKLAENGLLLLYIGQNEGLPTIITKGNPYYSAINKLYEYELTNLTPAQLREIDNLYAEKCKEVSKLEAEFECVEEVNGNIVRDNNCKNQMIEILKAEIKQLKSESLTGYETAQIYATLNHFKKLKDQGRLIELPCNVGDIVYEPNKRGFISTYKITSIVLMTGSRNYNWELIDGIYSNLNGFNEFALGKSVFLTRDQAEKALSEVKE